ncbi:hypothetical protein [Solirubrobacter soli]|uniref:hypothetical protein n=1 Tax=Solirubrobacter soli TaxID=363832 RepID=UPI000406E600|nr:hypothetical protein [Solirubrobacter soli]
MSPKLLCRAAAAALLAAAVVAAPAHAAAGKPAAKPRYQVQTETGKAPLTFKNKATFEAYVRDTMKLDLSKAPRKATKPKAKATWNGDYATFYQHYDGYGWAFNINSGYGESDLYRVGCFLWFCSNYNDAISSVYTHGVPAVLYSETGYRGSVFVVGANVKTNIPYWFNDYASSAYVYWS